MWHIWVQAWLITHFFMFHSLQPWQLLHVWQKAFEGSGKRESLGREHKGRVREGGRESEEALSSWPTSSVIMPWSRNEAFGSTPGFWEQRCELLMLAVGPAWHPLPFPSSPCLGRLPDTPPPPAGTAKRIRIKRETCFSLASCSGPMTSPLQPPAPRFQPPSTFFPSRRRPSILFEFHHFIPISK